MPENKKIIPIKTELGGELKQFRKGDAVPVEYGGTGTTVFPPNTPARKYNGMIVGNGTNPLQILKCEYEGKRDPNYLDGRKRGYSKGSRWINIEENSEWVCVDSKDTGDGAIWIQTGAGDTPFGDTFRYYASLVDFVYDYQHYSWTEINYKKEVTQIDYFNGGSGGVHVATMSIDYNAENQPVKITMVYLSPSRPDKTLDYRYDDDGYFDTMTRT